MASFFGERVAAIFYVLVMLGLVFVITAFTIQRDENLKKIQILESEIKSMKEHAEKIEKAHAACSATVVDCSATLQACIGSCVEYELKDVVKEAIRIKR